MRRSVHCGQNRSVQPEEKTRIVVEGLRGETTIAELCRREGISESLYYGWSKELIAELRASLNVTIAR